MNWDKKGLTQRKTKANQNLLVAIDKRLDTIIGLFKLEKLGQYFS